MGVVAASTTAPAGEAAASSSKTSGAASVVAPTAAEKTNDSTVATSSPGATACGRLVLVITYTLLLCVTVVSTYGIAGDFGPHHSLRRPTAITPERWAFAVWLVILALQGLAVLDQMLPISNSGSWKLEIMRIVGVTWPLGWLFEVGNLLASYSHSEAGLWAGLACLVGANAAFSHALVNVYSLRRRLALGPPAIHLYYLFFTSTAVNAAWLSFSLADGVLVICQTYGMPPASLQALAICLLVAITGAGVWVVSRKKSTEYGLTLIWVLVAVYGQPHTQSVRVSALMLLAVTGLATIFSVMRRKSACCTRTRSLHADDHSKLLSASTV